MLGKILIFALVFSGVFYLVNLLYPFFASLGERWQKQRIEKITPKLDRMFIDVPLNKLILLDVLAPLVTGCLGFIFFRNLVLAGVAAGVGLIIPLFAVKRMEASRRKKFAGQLVDGLMVLSSSLKAGLSLQQAFEALIEEMPAPIAQEFGLVIRQIQMGVPLEEALVALKKRMRLDEMDLVVTAMLVARETGGDLTITFSRVINTIQERNKLIGRVNALCIQAKLQGIIMSVLPILFGLFVYKTNPTFFDVFFQDPLGRGLLIYAGVSEALGVFFIRKFSKVDV